MDTGCNKAASLLFIVVDVVVVVVAVVHFLQVVKFLSEKVRQRQKLAMGINVDGEMGKQEEEKAERFYETESNAVEDEEEEDGRSQVSDSLSLSFVVDRGELIIDGDRTTTTTLLSPPKRQSRSSSRGGGGGGGGQGGGGEVEGNMSGGSGGSSRAGSSGIGDSGSSSGVGVLSLIVDNEFGRQRRSTDQSSVRLGDGKEKEEEVEKRDSLGRKPAIR